MPKKIRDWLFIIFVFFFVIGTTLISIYASGYQINLGWPLTFNRLLIKTGMIVVDSSPSGATVYLNDKPQANFSINPWKKEYLTTSTKIKNILPGDYSLTLKLAGYLPLTKKITVYSGQTTFVKDVNLFRSNLPRLILSAPESDLTLSADGQYIYLPAINTILDPSNNQKKILTVATGTPGTWLKNSDRLLAGGQIISAGHGTTVDYGQLLGGGLTNWYDDENSGRLYYQNKGSLNYLQTSSQANVTVLSGGNYLTYEPQGDNLFLVSNENSQTVLEQYSFKTQKIEQEINLPAVGRYLFVAEGRRFLTLSDTQNNTLYILDPANIANGGENINNVLSWQWLDDYTLLYNNSWEIYRLDLRQNQSSLLTRVGQKIIKIIWNSRSNYLIYSTADGLYAYDLPVGLTTKIFTAEKVASPTLDESSGTLYFWAKIGQQEGIYSLLLQ